MQVEDVRSSQKTCSKEKFNVNYGAMGWLDDLHGSLAPHEALKIGERNFLGLEEGLQGPHGGCSGGEGCLGRA